jgi:hypothetical protein
MIQPIGEFLLYETEDGKTRVECRFSEETLWLSQAMMAELFQTTPQNITLHLKALYAEGEIDPASTCSRSHKQAIAHAEAEYERFAAQRRALLEAEGEVHNVQMLEDAAKAVREPGGKLRTHWRK